jgi:hypothetical protein
MNDGLMEQLLHEGESSSLDYKRDQYPFAGASDEDKGELLKDILAFANGWRHTDGYILIGVDEVAGGRSNVVGVTHHIPENDLQQFVNTKTNRPVAFSYRAYPFEGKQVGVITVPQQDRPIYLMKNFGKLQKQVVYYRQGTTTAIATPDDIARMGSGPAKQQASLVVEFADIDREVSLGSQIDWTAELCRMPEPKDIPTVKERQERLSHPILGSIALPTFSSLDLHDRLNNRYHHERAEYEFCKRLFRKVRLVVSNTGDVPASDVRVEMSVPTKQGIVVMRPSKFPEVPKRRTSLLAMPALRDLHFRRPFREAGDVDIDENEHRYKVEVECGTLQPGRQVWSDEFYIGIGSSGEIELAGRLLAGNLPEPQEFTLTIDANVSETEMTVDELVSLADPVDDDE